MRRSEGENVESVNIEHVSSLAIEGMARQGTWRCANAAASCRSSTHHDERVY